MIRAEFRGVLLSHLFNTTILLVLSLGGLFLYLAPSLCQNVHVHLTLLYLLFLLYIAALLCFLIFIIH